ncbi:hypothetical protein G6L68_25060 [Agrobacterium fabrum]|uniref:hypothetical protein n=1 Tax=Agrobacterium fabrum TaxID=1176649 RepID=UPI000EF62B85|nr:hypothetical protein [Agrobacterium fabrum]AYM66156.1 hypothetical protein At12D13_50040 [Agrobacterium fabrum]NTE63903.1 hypothetical protein [Agrobacterium fabrum]
MASLKQLQNHSRVEDVEDYRSIGRGVFVTLKRGWTIDPIRECRSFGEDTIKEAMDMVRFADAYAGPYHD